MLPANVLFDTALRQSLQSVPDLDCSSEFLDEVDFPTGYRERLLEFLRVKYVEKPPDVLVAFGSRSLDFCLQVRPQLFPDVPIVFAGLGRESPGEPERQGRVTGIRATFDGPGTLHMALRLHPHTREVFVVRGEAPIDTAAAALGWSTFRPGDFRATFHFLERHPLQQLLQRLSELPPNSLVIDLALSGSDDGPAVPAREAVESMARVSQAPMYAAFDTYLGQGLLGTVTTSMQTIGHETGEQVAEILASRGTDRLPGVRTLEAIPIFDGRQLRRWGIRKKHLPPGSQVRFEEPSFWRQHLALVIVSSGLFLLQSGLILALVLQGRSRRRAQREAQRRRQELEHMTRVATMGELTASLAHEINQPLAAILSNAQAAQRLLAAGGVDAAEIGDILADIAADDLRAGEVIRRMRALLRKGDADPTTLDVNDLVAEVIGLLRGEMILQNVSLALDLAPGLHPIHGDRVQLQQVLLNLMVNALDALKDTTASNRKVVVRTATPEGGFVRVEVEDAGAGVPADKLESVFDPFVTTKPHGMGLGLAICRSIILAHGGRIGSSNNPAGGATFWFTLPALMEAKR